jgi:hypothetical protein
VIFWSFGQIFYKKYFLQKKTPRFFFLLKMGQGEGQLENGEELETGVQLEKIWYVFFSQVRNTNTNGVKFGISW